jgi:hypothetical protein
VLFLLWAGSVGDFEEDFPEALGHEFASFWAAHLVDEAVGEGIEHGGEARGEVYLVFLKGFFGVGEADGLAGGGISMSSFWWEMIQRGLLAPA